MIEFTYRQGKIDIDNIIFGGNITFGGYISMVWDIVISCDIRLFEKSHEHNQF